MLRIIVLFVCFVLLLAKLVVALLPARHVDLQALG